MVYFPLFYPASRTVRSNQNSVVMVFFFSFFLVPHSSSACILTQFYFKKHLTKSKIKYHFQMTHSSETTCCHGYHWGGIGRSHFHTKSVIHIPGVTSAWCRRCLCLVTHVSFRYVGVEEGEEAIFMLPTYDYLMIAASVNSMYAPQLQLDIHPEYLVD